MERRFPFIAVAVGSQATLGDRRISHLGGIGIESTLAVEVEVLVQEIQRQTQTELAVIVGDDIKGLVRVVKRLNTFFDIQL